ncbi:RIP metalloprotease RseP [Neorickettsia risticii str. Illinois]|uniref:Zinc metalloprotease n=1 Tax=Neorickettsia risticii (strain Illinois) TaxID=434131 RepID=C6V5K3_NEORI|nr:RIP metalloprotease RseP [Neorickettsia risticii]ACT69677.1 RIP metalloprotease RseP [Neorickettsia risticii str. Illinois]
MGGLLLYLASFVLVVSVIVFAHEFGHYIFAKMFGVKVEEFSIGFGKELFGFNDKSGTRWKLSMIPAGGYVKMFGDLDESSATDFEKIRMMDDCMRAQTLNCKPLYQKALVIFGGPFANFVFAFLILSFLYGCFGKVTVEPVVASVIRDSPAAHAGFRVGDRILTMNNKPIVSFDEIRKFIYLNRDSAVSFTVSRNGDEISISVTPRIEVGEDIFGNREELPKLGIEASKIQRSEIGVLDAMRFSLIEIGNVVHSTLKLLGQTIAGKAKTDAIGGPIKIAKYSGQSMRMGFTMFLWFMAMLSINLGLFNLFPIPMLDGGHLLFYLIEWIKGDRVAVGFQQWAGRAGMLLLIAILVFAVFNDIRFVLR